MIQGRYKNKTRIYVVGVASEGRYKRNRQCACNVILRIFC